MCTFVHGGLSARIDLNKTCLHLVIVLTHLVVSKERIEGLCVCILSILVSYSTHTHFIWVVSVSEKSKCGL